MKLAYDKKNAAEVIINAAKHANTCHTIGNLYWIGFILFIRIIDKNWQHFNILFFVFRLGHQPFDVIGLEVYTFSWSESIYFILES